MLKKLIAGFTLAALALLAAGGPERVPGSQQQKRLIKKVDPKYPPEAKAKGIQGTVRLEATINKDGSIKELKVVSGPEDLVPPSLQAVKQWVYEPLNLNGEPVEVITEIDINYKLDR